MIYLNLLVKLIGFIIDLVIIFLVLSAIIFVLHSCSKQTDYSYLNTDRRDCAVIIRVSKRYNEYWRPLPDSVVNTSIGEYCGHNKSDLLALKPDTIISSCSIDKIDSSFRIEIRYYTTK